MPQMKAYPRNEEAPSRELSRSMRQLPENFDRRITEAIVGWAHDHPHPCDPVTKTLAGKSLTPIEYAEQIVERTPLGVEELEVLRDFARTDLTLGGEGLISMFATARGENRDDDDL